MAIMERRGAAAGDGCIDDNHAVLTTRWCDAVRDAAVTAALVTTETAAGGARTEANNPQDTSAKIAVTCDTRPE